MKKVFNLLLISLFSLSVFSQNISKELRDNLAGLYDNAASAAKGKDYKKAIALYDSIVSYCSSLSDKDKESISGYLGSVYYNSACYCSLLNDKEKAIDNFEKAIEYRWNNYAHALRDSDLDNLRNEKRFQEAMLKLKKAGDFLQILKDAPDYNNDMPKEKIQFTYLDASDPDLVHIRQYFNLDSIAGDGDEVSQIKNLMITLHITGLTAV